MINMLMYDTDEKEAKLICRETKEQAALLTDDVWNIHCFICVEDCLVFAKKNEMLDVICYDITELNGIEQLENMRLHFKSAYIIILANADISPVSYMKPSIMASSLILKPAVSNTVSSVIKEMVNTFYNDDNADNYFVVEDLNGRNRIPYFDILFFESREKKIYVCTKTQQFGFYDTIERLSKTLPDMFVRCHRSYIVNTYHIKKVIFTDNIVCLNDGSYISLSRSYRTVMKEYKYGRED